MTTDERIEALEKRIEALEMLARLQAATDEEEVRLRAERAKHEREALPPQIDREGAVLVVGALLRPMLAMIPPEKRAQALAEATPAETLAEIAPLVPEAMREQLAVVRAYALEHALTWGDLGITA